jgi:hypothetical protein
MWQAALYRMEPASLVAGFLAGHIWPGPFFVLAPPPLAMVVWTCVWIVVVSALAARSFALRDL